MHGVLIKLFGILTSIVLIGCGEPLCENNLVHEVSSPEKTYVTAVFTRECGATTPTIHVVSLRSESEPLNMEDSNQWVFTAHGKSQVNVEWSEQSKLLISYMTEDRSPTKKSGYENLTINYQLLVK